MEKCQYDELKAQQNIHWWFTGKREIVIDYAETHLGMKKANECTILDIGCGMGLMLDVLQEYGHCYGIDMEEEAVTYCNQTLSTQGYPETVSIGLLPDDIPFQNEMFDYIFALDIIEHIKDDNLAIHKIYSLLKKGGKAIVTVPALMNLWSYNDELNHHYRRYEKEELIQKIEQSGLKVVSSSYYNSYLYLPALIIRKTKNLLKIHSSDVKNESKDSMVNTTLRKIFVSEKRRLRKKGFKKGVSIIVACEKKE